MVINVGRYGDESRRNFAPTNRSPVHRTRAFHMSVFPGKRHPAKVRATLYLSADLLNEARNAAVFLAGHPVRLTLTKLAEDALREQLEQLKRQYNGGEEFPQRGEDLRGGRPIAA
jgi:hypothetical protein